MKSFFFVITPYLLLLFHRCRMVTPRCSSAGIVYFFFFCKSPHMCPYMHVTLYVFICARCSSAGFFYLILFFFPPAVAVSRDFAAQITRKWPREASPRGETWSWVGTRISVLSSGSGTRCLNPKP